MKKMFLLLLFMILGTGFMYAQENDAQKSDESENVVSHNVAMGETVMLISKKYKVTPYDIYELNPDAIEGLTYNMVLKIPMHKSHKAKDAKQNKPKEPKKVAVNDQEASTEKGWSSNK